MRGLTGLLVAAAVAVAPACGGGGVNSMNTPDGGSAPDARVAGPDAHVAGPDARITGLDGGSPDAASRQGVTGTAMEAFVTDSGTQELPVDLSHASIAALVVDGSGRFTRYAGAGTAEGTFSIPDLPAGATSYYLEEGNVYDVTSARRIDLGFATRGRADRTYISAPTPMTFDVSNMSRWSSSDELDLYSPHAGAAFSYPEAHIKTPIAAGATSLSFTVDYAKAELPAAVDSAKGDTAFIAHNTGVSHSDGSRSSSLTELAHLDSFSIVNGQPVTVSGAFQTVPHNRTASFDYRVSKFQKIIDASVTNPLFSANSLSLFSVPGDASLGLFTSAPSLASYTAGSTATDAKVSFKYGNPYPKSWTPTVDAFSLWTRALTLAGGETYQALGFVDDEATLADASGKPIAPGIRPPASVTIAGQDAGGNVSGVGTTPKLQWPAVNGASYYRVLVNELIPSSGSVSRSYVALIDTTRTEVIVPPNLLHGGQQYYLQISAVSEPNTDITTTPYRRSFPYASADFVSGVISP